MGRVLLQYILPLLLPTLIYLGWAAAERRRTERAQAGEAPRWQDAPWIWLAGAGLVLATVTTVALSLFGGSGIEGTYVPPRLEGGRVVPGHVEPAPKR
jgi:hypothetical protein